MSLIIKITMSKSIPNENTQYNENDKALVVPESNGNCFQKEVKDIEYNGNPENTEPIASTSQADEQQCESNINKSSSNSKLLTITKRNREECKTHYKNTNKINQQNQPPFTTNVKKKSHNWVLKFNCAKLKPKSSAKSTRVVNNDTCVCTGYRKVEDSNCVNDLLKTCKNIENVSNSDAETQRRLNATTVREAVYMTDEQDNQLGSNGLRENSTDTVVESLVASRECLRNLELPGPLFRSTRSGQFLFVTLPPLIDLTKFNPDDYPTEDIEERARLQRAVEIAEGIDAPPVCNSNAVGFRPTVSSITPSSMSFTPSTESPVTPLSPQWSIEARQWQFICPTDMNVDSIKAIITQHFPVTNDTPRVHTQVDYIHCLVPDLKQITACGFYWGKMDRYEAETLLEGKAEGTFLLRDSAQEEYLFSVSFRKYGRSLHARIEQFNHRFSFDSHDPGVFSSTSVTGLLEHYKDPTCVMFFEPMLTVPLNRSFSFSLQQLCRSVIVSNTSYDGISNLCLPRTLRSYLKEYHYRQRVRVKRFDEGQSCLS